MSSAASLGVGVVIIVLMVLFIGIWIWAWLPYHKQNFDLLARMPMLDVAPRGARRDNDALAVAKEDVALDEDYR